MFGSKLVDRDVIQATSTEEPETPFPYVFGTVFDWNAGGFGSPAGKLSLRLKMNPGVALLGLVIIARIQGHDVLPPPSNAPETFWDGPSIAPDATTT